MTNHSNRTLARLAPLAAAATLLASACGSSTTTSQADGQLPEAAVAAADAALDMPVSTDPAEAAPPENEPETTEPTTTDPDPGPDPAADPGLTLTPDPVPACGDFGPIPPTPDSMPTLMYDTDGDGNVDDEVTAYAGGGDSWVLRVVENGAISEAQTPGIDGWAYISNDYQVDGRDYIEVTDNDQGTIYTLATVKGCVKLLDTRNPIDELATPTPTPTPVPPACGSVEPIPPTATIVSDMTLDVTGDGVADDQVVSYLDAGWYLRATVDGVTSEIDVSGVGPGSVNVLGTEDIGALTAGNEIIATVGAGASSVQIGMYGIDTDGCIFAFQKSGIDFVMSAGASIGGGTAFFCGTGYVAGSGWDLEDDGTYFMSSAAFEESSPGEFAYMMSSDDFSEGIAAEDLPASIIDCNGMTV